MTGQVCAYARVSSVGQDLEVQKQLLGEAGYDKLFLEKASGVSQRGRTELARALDYVREGDTLIVTRLDRLARSMSDLREIIDRLTDKGVAFRALQQGAIDTTSSSGRLMLNMLAAFAEFESDLRRERQREGIDKAKAAGVYRGRPKSVNEEKIRQLLGEGVGPTEVARRLNVGRATVYRIKGAAMLSHAPERVVERP